VELNLAEQDRKRKETVISKRVAEIDSSDEDENSIATKLPTSHFVALEGHRKALQCIDIDRHGNRMISGGLDYILKIWDFPGMNR
jgi:WD40 repeat protein